MNNKDLLVAGKNAELMNIFDKGNALLPFSQRIYLYTLQLAGIRYYINNELDLNEKDNVILKREPHNEYDEYAIAVFTTKNEKLGYIPRRNNKIFARLMDGGKMLVGELEDVEYWFDDISSISIRIYLEDL